MVLSMVSGMATLPTLLRLMATLLAQSGLVDKRMAARD